MSVIGSSGRWLETSETERPPAGLRPAHLFRREFELDRPVRRASVAATAHGVYELFLNGARVGEQELTPGFTSYRTRLQVQRWEASAFLVPGRNAIGVILSDGWFRGRHGFERDADGFGERTALLAELEVEYTDGTTVLIVSDEDWLTAPSHIVRADLMDGQATDLRRYDPGWARPGENSITWHPAPAVEGGLYDDRDRLIAEHAEPVRRIEQIVPTAITEPAPGTVVVDFGQNINGWVRLSALGEAGTALTLVHGEVLSGAGLVDTENLRAFDFATGEPLPAGQIDEVISAGRPGDVFEPRHTTHGFRYVQIDGVDVEITPDDIRAVVVHSDLTPVGSFASSDPRLNALYDATVWSLRDNVCDIPTDCPQRERSGFTGDWQIFVETASKLFDVSRFSEKWLRDLEADQWPDGRVPTIIPNPAGAGPSGRWFADISTGSAGWGDAAAIVPWELWRAYGDREALARAISPAARWVDYAALSAAGARHPDRAARRPEPGIHERFLWDTGFHFGEWLEPGVAPAPDPSVDHGIVATAFLHRSADLVARMLRLVGDEAVATTYAAVADGALDAWRTEYLTVDGLIRQESQATYVRALAFGLIPEDLRARAIARLVELIEENGGRLSTGFLSTGQLLPVLADHGEAEVAYRVLFSHGVPSWMEMLDRGATTIWEWWDAIDGDVVRGSLNHYSKGAVVSFLFTHVAGIRIPEFPSPDAAGYRQVDISPMPGGGLTRVDAAIESAIGRIAVNWRIDDELFTVDVTTPAACRATLALPDGSRHALSGGTETFTCAIVRVPPRSRAG